MLFFFSSNFTNSGCDNLAVKENRNYLNKKTLNTETELTNLKGRGFGLIFFFFVITEIFQAIFTFKYVGFLNEIFVNICVCCIYVYYEVPTCAVTVKQEELYWYTFFHALCFVCICTVCVYVSTVCVCTYSMWVCEYSMCVCK